VVEDPSLLEQLPAPGSPAADLALLYTRHRPELLRFLRARCGDVTEAEDIVQELWLRLQSQHLGAIANGRAYLYQMANHLALDRARERHRRLRRDHDWSESVHAGDWAAGEVAAPEPVQPDALIEQEELQTLSAAIASLPEGARRAFCLHKLEGRSHAEVAAQLGISRSGVEKHIAVAMQHLRRAMVD
jgi:RNA polymerase sigma factor (sigma-70 family)